MIKNVLFDLDDTILDFGKAERDALSRAFTEKGIEPTDELLSRYSVINEEHWKRLEREEISRDEVKYGRFRQLFDEYGIAVSPVETADLYEEFLSHGHYFIDGAEALLSSLSEKYRLYLVSNGTYSVQEGRLASSGIEKYFKGIFISEKVGYEKPKKEFFDVCFSHIPDFSKEETVIIGDSLTSDMLGGKNAGIKTVWFNRKGKTNTTDMTFDSTATSLFEIEDIIKNL